MTIPKHCPYCRHLVKINSGQERGLCDRCGNIYVVKYHLTKIRLKKEYIPRDYDAEVLEFLRKRRKSYAGEISSHIGASKGVVSQSLRRLEARKIIIFIPRGKTKWVHLSDERKKRS